MDPERVAFDVVFHEVVLVNVADHADRCRVEGRLRTL